ncbi:hypothetical protein I7I50_11749 [Histoplasma capsulatum G186AR]|uniref:Uncharacterized protein n=1 Tax=Ajellomyces capsulatus TaxID=5037 RepID=A0A8H7Z603_AJECA|nr:hypothetical protein I7I52_02987 [Histoplasma capsulatum]QSS70195.1 hypothetical protein I7I50_11749 [Histoplasma capsulatum G186AR]
MESRMLDICLPPYLPTNMAAQYPINLYENKHHHLATRLPGNDGLLDDYLTAYLPIDLLTCLNE